MKTDDFNEDLKNNPQRQFRILLERPYCSSSPIDIQDETLISTILLGMNVFDVCLALEYYGVESLLEALDNGIRSGFIREEYKVIIENQIKASQEYLNGFETR